MLAQPAQPGISPAFWKRVTIVVRVRESAGAGFSYGGLEFRQRGTLVFGSLQPIGFLLFT